MATPLLLTMALGVASAGAAVPAGLTDWKVLQEEPVEVQCAPLDGFTWCQAHTTIEVSRDRLIKIMWAYDRYPRVFDRVSRCREIDPDVIHVTLDMPFPLAPRDYVVHYSYKRVGDRDVFEFKSVASDKAPPTSDVVRLPYAGGAWELRARGPAATEITYTWNGELGGDVPSWALERAWKTQGTEVMGWLETAGRN